MTQLDRIVIKLYYPHDESCSICLESMLKKQVYKLPCNHAYHTSCFTKLMYGPMQYSNSCPMCRLDLTKPLDNMRYNFSTDRPWKKYLHYVRALSGGEPPWAIHPEE